MALFLARAGWIAPPLILLGAEVAEWPGSFRRVLESIKTIRVLDLFRLMKPDAKKRSISNTVGSLGNAPKHIQEKQIGHFLKADPAYGRGVAEGLGINVEHLVPQEPVLASD